MPQTILLPIDLNHKSSWDQTLPIAAEMATGSASTVHVLTVIPDFGMSVVGSFFPPDYEKKAMAETEAALSAFVSQQFIGSATIDTHVRHGTVYKEILAAADQLGCDLIVMASHRPETKDYLLGPNAARVVRHAKQSVYVVRDS
jgi:nucleotide-binding universal stress UspA family protein